MLKTKYINEDDYKMFFGIDLQNLMRGGDNPSDTTNAFLKRVEIQIETYLDSNYQYKIDQVYKEFSDYQKEHYKLALLYQAQYILRNGDLSVDSGYDSEKGVIVDKKYLKSIKICEETIEHLRLCGLTYLGIKGNGGVIRGGWWY